MLNTKQATSGQRRTRTISPQGEMVRAGSKAFDVRTRQGRFISPFGLTPANVLLQSLKALHQNALECDREQLECAAQD